MEKSLWMLEHHYGKGHIKTAEILRDFGKTYLAQGCLNDAEKFIKKSLNILAKHNHPDRYASFECLAELYIQKALNAKKDGHVQESEKFRQKSVTYLKQALITAQKAFPKDSGHIARILLSLRKMAVLHK